MTTEASRSAAALVAHEISGTLSVIVGYASLVLDGSLDGQPELKTHAAEKVIRHGADLKALTEALLVSLTSNGKEHTAFDLRAVARLAVERMRDRANLDVSHLSEVGLDEEEEPVLIHANRAHVLCIITCLLSNAVVYSARPAMVVLELRDGDPVEIAVHDRGYGIAEQSRRQLFEREFRLCDGLEGFGLGLALSREMAERYGGKLRLESSQVGKGSTFVLALPRAATLEGGA